MFISRKDVGKRITLLENTLKCLLKEGQVSIEDIRKKTIYQFGSREISWTLKRLRKLGLVTYEGRVWSINQNVLKGLGLLATQEIMNYILKKG